MKKHLIVISSLIFVIISAFLLSFLSQDSITTQVENKNLFGKIISNNANLLKTPTKLEDSTSTFFLLEESYFVKVINEINDDYYYVSYKDLTGYVKKDNILIVNEQIENPYLENITFNISKDCFLYTLPINNPKNQILKLNKNKTITYYGKIFADEIAQNSGDVWYFVGLETENGKVFGYVHSSFTFNLSPILPCKEISTEYISTTNPTNLLNLNLKTQSILIIIISLPTLFLLIILLKGFKKIK